MAELKRKAFLSHLSAAMNKLNTQLDEDTIDEVKVKSLVEQVTQKFLKIEVSTAEIQEGMEETALMADMEKIDEIENQVIDAKVKAKAVLDQIHKKPDTTQVFSSSASAYPTELSVPRTITAKLPEATLREFHGDEESFPSFIDNFTALVDSNPYLPDIEKFSYLRGVVKVDVINHYPLTSENYKLALEKLKRVYGDQTIIATKHMNALLDMNKRKKPSNSKELEDFYNFLETKLTCLDALKRPVSQTNEMLITLIYRQLPKELKKKIAQLPDARNTVQAVMDIISANVRNNKKMNYREASSDSESDSEYDNYYKRDMKKRKPPSLYENGDDINENNLPSSSGAALPVVSRQVRPCVYCNENHSPVHCHNVVDSYQRREVAKRNNRCYNCLTRGHRQSECRSPGRCRYCQGRHHTSLCNMQTQPHNIAPQHQQQQPVPQQQQQQRVAAEGQNTGTGRTPKHQGLVTAAAWEANGSVLLQLAEVELSKPHGTKFIPGNVFFDQGSQMSYVEVAVKEDLNLDVLGPDVLELNTFGTTKTQIADSEVVALRITKGGFSKEIAIHTTKVVCLPLPSFKISKRKLQELGSIQLAHPRCKFEGSHEINVLIGADLYWQFVGTESKTTTFGARAVNSKVGWLLSGVVDEKAGANTAVNLIHHISTKQLQSLKLDEVAVDKEWLKVQLPQMQQYHYLDKLQTVYDEETKEYKENVEDKENITTVLSTVCKKEVTEPIPSNKVSTYMSSSTLLAVRDTFYNQSNDTGDIEDVEDSCQYKVKDAVHKEVDLSWFWETEHVGILPEEKEPSVLQEFQESIRFVEETQRYEVSLPSKMKMMEALPDNFHICKLRLKSLLEKLNKPGNEKLRQEYNDIFTKQLQEGIIEEISLESSSSGVLHYLPHHPVIRPDKDSARVVYDGSAKSHKKSISLNQCLHAGPNLVKDLTSILVRFRMFPIGLVADIRKAFLQLVLREEDRDVTRFLWREDGKLDNPLKIYRFMRVPFGLTSSPFLLHATIIHHLHKYQEKYPVTVSKLLEAFYVDDMVTGADTEEEAIQLAEEGRSIMKEANMELAKWNTNSPYLFNMFQSNDVQAKETAFKVLGILWNTQSDEFKYNYTSEKLLHQAESLKPTKRTVLKIVSGLYDPLGSVSPYIVTAKMLLQKLCKLQLTWDELLPEEILKEWRSWVKGLQSLKNFTLPRCINRIPQSSMELAGFCDASLSAYAAVIYLRCSKSKVVNIRFVMSRSRVAPMKPLTIARLELLGAVLLVRLMSAVIEYLSRWKFTRITYYTDSKNVLYWITGDKMWNHYVTKRLEEIRARSSKNEWQHCPGEENPADLPTRGMTMECLSESQKWLQGPAWLSELNFQPQRREFKAVPSPEVMKEEKQIVHLHVAVEKPGIDKVIKLDKYSTFKKLCHITANVLLFTMNCRKMKGVSYKEMMLEAERRLILNEQRKYYNEQISYLTHETSKPVGSVARQLDLFLDKEGLIRCAGRFKYSALSYTQKYPILLPRESHITTLLIENRHCRVKHAGVKTTLTEIREDFWIPRGRRMVKNIIAKCIICRRLSAKPFKAPGPPPLPPIRLADMPPFTNSGVDFAGPVYCRERGSRDAYKSYIALFTCASTRAVSLELVPNMTAESFQNAMIRFVSNRGVPHVMISDNAKTFQKTAVDLNSLITRSPTKEFIEDNRITWLFYLEKSPWWGGFIERMVGSVKSVLRKALYRTFLSYDEMSTLLKQIEAVINSRPITYIYDDDIDEPLTPSHLLIGKRSTQLPPSTQNSYDKEGRSMYRENLLSQFQKRWKKEYLAELQDYHILMQKTAATVDRTPKVGEVVIMKEDKPRNSWKLAKVTNIYTAKDGKIRSIEVMKPNRKLARRPPQLLIPLECVNK